jgi:hypothetical protein
MGVLDNIVGKGEELIQEIGGLSSDGTKSILPYLGPVGAGVGGAVIGAGVGSVATSSILKSKSKRRKRAKSRGSRKRTYRGKHRARYTPRTAGKRKDRSHKRIRYTKNGQPYVIKANGRALFIKKSSARRSRKLKGGRY